MHDAALVRGLERVGDLSRDAERFLQRQRPNGETLHQRLARNELHDERQRAVAVLEPVDLRDVRMIELCEQLRLALKPREALRVAREGRRQHLDRHVALQCRIACAVHLAHAARTERRSDLEATETGAGGEGHGLNAPRASYTIPA
jgi:hypothetical protein